ncbi:hypothetical protein Tco_0536309 [Tanacetum coccineum]
MSARGRDHRRQQPRNTAARTSGHATRDPRDVEIERLRKRIRELAKSILLIVMNEKIILMIRHHKHLHDTRQPPAPHHPTDPLRSLGIRTEIPEFDGKLHPDDFLDWLQTVERIFDLRDIPDNVSAMVWVSSNCEGPNKTCGHLLTVVEPKFDTENEDASNKSFVLIALPMGRVSYQSLSDGGRCEKMVAKTMVVKLGLLPRDHPDPYQLTWFRKGNLVKVTQRCLVAFSIGNKYKDELRCEVVPMDASVFTSHGPLLFLRTRGTTRGSNTWTKDDNCWSCRQHRSGVHLGLVVLEENTPISDVPHEDYRSCETSNIRIDFMPGATIPIKPAHIALENPKDFA